MALLVARLRAGRRSRARRRSLRRATARPAAWTPPASGCAPTCRSGPICRAASTPRSSPAWSSGSATSGSRPSRSPSPTPPSTRAASRPRPSRRWAPATTRSAAPTTTSSTSSPTWSGTPSARCCAPPPRPLFLLSRLVREQGYKVVLTGEGADEMLGGYDIFKEAKVRRFWARQIEFDQPPGAAAASSIRTCRTCSRSRRPTCRPSSACGPRTWPTRASRTGRAGT